MNGNQAPFDPRPDRPSPAIVADRPVNPPVNRPVEGLFHGLDAENFRTRWREVQGTFVDAPEEAVKQADQLVETVIQRLETEFAATRTNLERAWTKEGQISTEDLRQALQRYRAFFDRLLSV